MLSLNIKAIDDDIVDVMGALYVKTPSALKRLLKQLRTEGYQIDNLREDEHRKKDGTTVEQMEKNGWSLWFAALRGLNFGVCGTCKQLISTSGIRSHGHKCEKCGAVTYYDLIDGSTLTFVFNNDEERGFLSPQLRMKVKRWDTENGYIYLYHEFLEGGLSVVTGERAEAYLKRNQDKWKIGSDGDGELLVIKYDLQWNRKTAVIEPYDHFGSYHNHKIVKVWKDKQYAEYDRLPIQEMINIYESWHWSPLPSTPRLYSRILHAAGQVDDKGWHYQDGRPFYSQGVWQEMAKFVRHFTSLDADAFDRAWPRFRRDGPGGIDDLAQFCHPASQVRNEPNIGNVLIALGKGLGGKDLTEQEVLAAKEGLADPAVKNLFSNHTLPKSEVRVPVVTKKCERCGDDPRVEVCGHKFCFTHGYGFLREEVDRWQVEYDNPSTSHGRKVYIWFFKILPAMQAKDDLVKKMKER